MPGRAMGENEAEKWPELKLTLRLLGILLADPCIR